MASTSTPADQPDRESANTSQGTAPSSSTSVIIPSPTCLWSSCFDWVSSFIPWRSGQSNSMPSTSIPDRIQENEVMGASEGIAPYASTSTSDCIPENEVMDVPERISIYVSTSTTDCISENKVTGAFHGIAPSISTSASTLMQKTCYDVFINHRGADVKHTLASSIYNILKNMKLMVFLDSEELEYGDFFPTTLEAAMRSAPLHIAIFSENYAKSSWCLAELSYMLKVGAKIIPVFYHVEPTDLRWVAQGKGVYAKAFKGHEQKGRYSLEQLQEWKRALYNISFYNGQIIRTNDDEMRLLKNIVNCALKQITNVPLVVAKHPVGLKEIVQDFEVNTLQSAQGDQLVQIVGICGMGGSGKTTLAKELYNKISSSMVGSSIVFEVRDAAAKGLLHEKQKKLLNNLGIKGKAFDNIEEGMGNLSRCLTSVRVLIVLDDVDNGEQLDALLPAKDNLERGSIIIVTTRAYDVLKCWGISSVYKMRPLSLLYATQLFCWHAFLQSFPPDGFEKLVKRFLKACQGLPLSLKVSGGQLYGESRKEYWESLLHNISRILPHDIKKKLKVSYDGLSCEEKQMFLDSACFFIGEKSSLAIQIWNGLGWSGLYSWEKLLNKCLVEIDNRNCIKMHDHLRDLGREIANKDSPYRLWLPQQIIDVEKYEENRIRIQGIMATSTQIRWSYYTEDETFPAMVEKVGEIDDSHISCSNGNLMVNTNRGIWSLAPSLVGLKIFVTSGNYFNQVIGQVSGELIWLRWFQIGQRNLPSGLVWKKLRVLELYEDWISSAEHHIEELWRETESEAPMQLRELRVSGCYKFQRFPKSIGRLNHLEKIVIIKGYNDTTLPDEFCLLPSLEHLVLYQCEMLSSLPSNFGNLRNLRHLNLSCCAKLRRFPDSFKSLMLLEYLNLEQCSQLTFTLDDLNILENMTNLGFLSVSKCKQLKELPFHITNQVFLRELYLEGTSLRKLPVNICELSGLRKIRIGSLLLTSLPTSLADLSFLTDLSIEGCPQLERLPDSLGGLSSLTNLSIQGCSEVEYLPDSLKDLSSLTNLSISRCHKLECLPASLGNLTSLMYLSIQNCLKLERLPDSLEGLSSLTHLSIYSCPKLGCLPDSLGHLNLLKSLNLVNSGVKSLSKSIRQLNNLEIFEIENCPISDLDFRTGSLPVAFNNLRFIHLQGTEVYTISISEDCCPRLKDLRICYCQHLKEIEALPRTVESIYLKKCEKLESIPNFEQLISLRRFSLRGCYRIKKIEGIENCKSLKGLTVDNCWEVPCIESLKHMEKLRQVNLRANKGSAIVGCIQTIQNFLVVESFSDQKIQSRPKLVHKCPSDGHAFLFCFVIVCVSSKMRLRMHGRDSRGEVSNRLSKLEKGRWVWIGVFSQRSMDFLFPSDELSIDGGDCREDDRVEKGWVVRGQEQTLLEAFRCMLPLLQS
ncbi:disease resistance protein RPV1-like [Cryptomeria japonica]|uniref:disease resistance protein RPV1-like n=1 Tax=Cryptomeria japonica TaxID=3369 RepID=UPI0027D9E7C0|nr:disease resistance protein RPV1-like [Cryptomeria japonica]